MDSFLLLQKLISELIKNPEVLDDEDRYDCENIDICKDYEASLTDEEDNGPIRNVNKRRGEDRQVRVRNDPYHNDTMGPIGRLR